MTHLCSRCQAEAGLGLEEKQGHGVVYDRRLEQWSAMQGLQNTALL
jgi:hypothetical protein